MSTILLVDDDPDVREVYRIILETEGYTILEAPDAPSCLEVVAEHRPDLILLDWMMPGVDGSDALRALKGSPATRDIPVVMLTALDGITEIRLATDIGADGFLSKPVEADDLLTIVRRYVQEPARLQPA